MTQKHTPGPWRTLAPKIPEMGTRGDTGIIADDGGMIGETWGLCPGPVPGGIGRADAEANARLIAAAPDMLEALRATFAAYQGPHLFSPAQQAAWALMQAAIAKAEGRS